MTNVQEFLANVVLQWHSQGGTDYGRQDIPKFTQEIVALEKILGDDLRELERQAWDSIGALQGDWSKEPPEPLWPKAPFTLQDFVNAPPQKWS